MLGDAQPVDSGVRLHALRVKFEIEFADHSRHFDRIIDCHRPIDDTALDYRVLARRMVSGVKTNDWRSPSSDSLSEPHRSIAGGDFSRDGAGRVSGPCVNCERPLGVAERNFRKPDIKVLPFKPAAAALDIETVAFADDLRALRVQIGGDSKGAVERRIINRQPANRRFPQTGLKPNIGDDFRTVRLRLNVDPAAIERKRAGNKRIDFNRRSDTPEASFALQIRGAFCISAIGNKCELER